MNRNKAVNDLRLCGVVLCVRAVVAFSFAVVALAIGSPVPSDSQQCAVCSPHARSLLTGFSQLMDKVHLTSLTTSINCIYSFITIQTLSGVICLNDIMLNLCSQVSFWTQEGRAKHHHLFAGFNCTEQTTQMIPFTQTAVVCQPTTHAVSLFICLHVSHTPHTT